MKEDDRPINPARCCPYATEFDPYTFEVTSSLRIIDGSFHNATLGQSVSLFAVAPNQKCWFLKNSSHSGKYSHYSHNFDYSDYFMQFHVQRFFQMYNEALGPSLAKMFDMSILDPKSEKEVDELLDAQIDL